MAPTESIISGGVALCILFTYRDRTELFGFLTPLIVSSLFILSFVAIKLIKVTLRPYRTSELHNVPGPDNNQFLVGQEIRIMTTPGPLDLHLEWMRKWPEAPFIRHRSFGNSEVLLVNSLEALKQVLQTKCYAFKKPEFFRKLAGEIVGKGLLLREGEEHKMMRRQLAGAFSMPNIRKLLPVFQEKAKDVSDVLNRVISSETKGVVDIESVYIKAMMDIVGVTILGVELGTLRSSSSSMNFVECYHAILAPPLLGKLITFINPFVPLRWLPMRANTDFIRANTEIQRILRDLTRQRWNEVTARTGADAKSKEDDRDVLTFMIETSLSDKVPWTEMDIVELVLQFVTAGHETTAGALTLTSYLLATNPDVQTRLREEVNATLAEHPQLDYTVIENMQYLNNVTREGLRLMPPAISAPREAAKELVIAGVKIPRGTTVTVIPAMIQRNPLVWGEDVEDFKPERWDSLSADAASPYSMVAFNGGPRICIGKAFAMLAFKAVLVEVIRNFILEPVDTEVKFANPSLTLQPVAGLRVRVRSAL